VENVLAAEPAFLCIGQILIMHTLQGGKLVKIRVPNRIEIYATWGFLLDHKQGSCFHGLRYQF